MTKARLLLVLATALAIGLAWQTVRERPSNGLPVDRQIVSVTEVGLLCALDSFIPPLEGSIEIDAADPERVWLHDDAGRRLSVRWPDGFSVTFADPVAVLDEEGRVVAMPGQQMTFPGVYIGGAVGTPGDPYVLKGMFGFGCYTTYR